MTRRRTAVIFGAGPAGLTAAYELLSRTDYHVIVLEASHELGGISRTVNYKGNRIDIGGHRFFSKSDRVMRWWFEMLPLQAGANQALDISYQRKRHRIEFNEDGPDPDNEDRVFLIRNRLSRIFYLRKFFDYPLALNLATLRNLGLRRLIRVGSSYLRASISPIKPEKTLEDFFINRFGRELYQTFFKDYTEKVWGVPCREIGSDWGAQRIKGLSVRKALMHALKQAISSDSSLTQKDTETSLIERFIYPKFGPGQMWETVAEKVIAMGGEIRFGSCVKRLEMKNDRSIAAAFFRPDSGNEERLEGDLFFSSMPVRDLVLGMGKLVPAQVRDVASGLQYRDFITVGVLVRKLEIVSGSYERRISDNWIYIQERDVKVGRIQLFNNWSPYMVKDPNTTWLGLEYFCNEGDDLGAMSDKNLARLAASELEKLGFVAVGNVLDSTVIRQPKAYPGYFGSYDQFDVIKDFLNKIDNLYPIGRNGMHKYNNQDHSMLTAMVAVDGILAGEHIHQRLWDINTEKDYHEYNVSSRAEE